MYPLRPLKVYVLDRVQDNPAWVARVERILGGIAERPDEIVTVTEANLPEAVAELKALWPPADVPDGVPPTFLRPIVFTTSHLDDEAPDVDALLERCPEGTLGIARAVLGLIERVRPTHMRESDAERNHVCWPTHDFGTMNGCPHGCHYCGEGKSGCCIVTAVNLEEFMDRVVGPTVEQFPWQKCFRMIGWGADHLTFEPENGVFDLLTRKLAEYPDRYAYFHTASSNVDWIADLPRRDRLIGVWSVTCEGVARLLEGGTGHAADRFEAGRKCQEMGVPIRYKFKPIIPIRGWREDYAQAIEQMLRRSKPESVGFCVAMWMPWEELARRVDPDLLDPDLVAAARDAADELKNVRTGPFPHAVRADIYRHFIREVRRWDSDVPLYVSTESREMWDELAGELGQKPQAYVCACSSVAIPGRRLALSKGCPASTYLPPEARPCPAQPTEE